MPKHYRPSGKKIQGHAAKYITRTKALRYLQISLQDFRRLCILKGIFPREPKKKFEGNQKTYYHTKDIAFLAHEPLLDKLREIRSYSYKMVKALGKNDKHLAQQLADRKPSYKLDRLIRERYPRFIDALADLDDCLTMVHLFAALPASRSERIEVNRIHNCQRLCAEWQAYISGTSSLQKTFLSVKGIVYEAEVQGQRIRWLTPHALQQVVTDDVDFNVMLTFLEFYESLLSFVNFKLFHSTNLKYPLVLDPRKEALEELHILFQVFAAKLEAQSLESPEVGSSQLELLVSTNKPSMLVELVKRSAVDTEESRTRSHKFLFENLKFFLSNEVAKESLLFVIQAFGGTVSWEGDGAPFKETEEGITHQIVDRPTLHHAYLSRDYVQPQWVYDCVNRRMILPTDCYMVGRVPPPHLSPFVDDEEEGGVPECATIKHLQDGTRNKTMPSTGLDKLSLRQYFDELSMESQGSPYSASVSDKNVQSPVDNSEGKDESVLDPEQMAKDASSLSEIMMPRKRRKLYEAMQKSNEGKRARVELWEERKKNAGAKASKCE